MLSKSIVIFTVHRVFSMWPIKIVQAKNPNGWVGVWQCLGSQGVAVSVYFPSEEKRGKKASTATLLRWLTTKNILSCLAKVFFLFFFYGEKSFRKKWKLLSGKCTASEI